MKLNEVEIILQGGLGNQMFQYAYGRCLAEEHNLKLKLNTYRYGIQVHNETIRDFALSKFSLSAEITSSPRLLGRAKFIDVILKRGLSRKYKYEGSIQDFSSINWGYWLDRSYSDKIRDLLLNDFMFKHSIPSEIQNLFDKIRRKKILAVHVRRGDYVTNPATAKTHGALSIDYYHNAIKKLKERDHFDEVWFFSDDPEWVENNFKDDIIIKHPFDPIFDIILMSKAHGIIISNSTFSWWSAWINNGNNIVAPRNWFTTLANPPIYSSNWITLE